MIELLASSIIITGNSSGVWSPSHPDVYPEPVVQTPVVEVVQITPEWVRIIEPPFVLPPGESILTDENGTPLIQ